MLAPRQVGILLAAGRIALGGTMWLAPGLAGRVIATGQDADGLAVFITRIAGVRDIALGVGALTTDGAARRQWIATGGACDVADLAAGLAAGAAGHLPRRSAALVAGSAAAGAAMALYSLSAD